MNLFQVPPLILSTAQHELEKYGIEYPDIDLK
jgi:hypothetical protein